MSTIVNTIFAAAYLLLIGCLLGLLVATAEPAVPYQAPKLEAPKYRGASNDDIQNSRDRMARAEEWIRQHEDLRDRRIAMTDAMGRVVSEHSSAIVEIKSQHVEFIRRLDNIDWWARMILIAVLGQLVHAFFGIYERVSNKKKK